ncbi:MAG: NIPSNAP family protein [Eubacteriaceae bacterium]
MIYELRIYTMAQGKEQALNDRFKNHTLDLFKKYGVNVCDFWTDLQGGKIYYICSFDDEQKREEIWNNFKADKDWIKAKSDSEVNGSLTDKVESILLKRVDYIKPDWK